MAEKNYTADDLNRIFGPGAADHADKLSSIYAASVPAAAAKALPASITRKSFYHLYTSDDGRYQRGLHLKAETPLENVKMPGYAKVKLVIARYPHHPSNTFKLNAAGNVDTRDGKPVFLVSHYDKEYEVIEGDPIVYEAPGHEEGADLDEALLAKENA